jgi:hypothetical protein
LSGDWSLSVACTNFAKLHHQKRQRQRKNSLVQLQEKRQETHPTKKIKTKNADSHEGRGCRKRRYGDHWAYIAAATTDFNLKFLSPAS